MQLKLANSTRPSGLPMIWQNSSECPLKLYSYSRRAIENDQNIEISSRQRFIYQLILCFLFFYIYYYCRSYRVSKHIVLHTRRQKSKPFWGGLTAFLHEGNQKIFKYDMHMSYLSGIIGIGTVGVWVFAVVRRVSRSSGTGAYPGYCQR